MRRWPNLSTHATLRCFWCEKLLVLQDSESTGFEHGNGSWRKHCPDCRMSTWYDVEPDPRLREVALVRTKDEARWRVRAVVLLTDAQHTTDAVVEVFYRMGRKEIVAAYADFALGTGAIVAHTATAATMFAMARTIEAIHTELRQEGLCR